VFFYFFDIMFRFLRKTRRHHEKSKQGNGIIALDVGSEIIKALLFVVEERQNANGEVIGRRAVIKGVGEVYQKGDNVQAGMITDIASVIENAKEAIRNASQAAAMEPTQLIVGVGGESVKGCTSILHYSREDRDSKINLSELHNIIHKLEWRAFAEVRKQMSEEMGYPEIDIKLIDSAVIDVRIDGYKVTNPLGFQGEKVQMAIFNSFAPLGHYGALHTIAKSFELELLGIISEPYALSRYINSGDANSSAIFIDVGGGGTEIAVVDDGNLMGAKMFGIGGRTFTKRLAIEFNVAFREAEKLKIAYSEDKLEQKSKKIISTIIQSDVEVWLEGVVLALSEFKQIDTLPARILLSGGASHLPEIKEVLSNRKWYKKLHFINPPQIAFIRPNALVNVIDETKKLKEQQYGTPMALVNIGIELSGEETIIQKTLRKVIGIMKV